MPPRRNKVSARRKTGRHKRPTRRARPKSSVASESFVLAQARDALQPDVNVDLVPSRASRAAVLSAALERSPVVVQWEAKPAEVKEYRPGALDADYVKRLVAKHGDDFTAMRRDTKLNAWQWSEGQIRKVAAALHT